MTQEQIKKLIDAYKANAEELEALVDAYEYGYEVGDPSESFEQGYNNALEFAFQILGIRVEYKT